MRLEGGHMTNFLAKQNLSFFHGPFLLSSAHDRLGVASAIPFTTLPPPYMGLVHHQARAAEILSEILVVQMFSSKMSIMLGVFCRTAAHLAKFGALASNPLSASLNRIPLLPNDNRRMTKEDTKTCASSQLNSPNSG